MVEESMVEKSMIIIDKINFNFLSENIEYPLLAEQALKVMHQPNEDQDQEEKDEEEGVNN
jgi:hypothetical protein